MFAVCCWDLSATMSFNWHGALSQSSDDGTARASRGGREYGWPRTRAGPRYFLRLVFVDWESPMPIPDHNTSSV